MSFQRQPNNPLSSRHLIGISSAKGTGLSGPVLLVQKRTPRCDTREGLGCTGAPLNESLSQIHFCRGPVGYLPACLCVALKLPDPTETQSGYTSREASHSVTPVTVTGRALPGA